jgi:hypothetical protein
MLQLAPSSRLFSYNDRLFSGGFRTWLHLARFRWLARRAAAMAPPPRSVFELGCHDCRSLDWLPADVTSYVGVDAGWNGGLDKARRTKFRLPQVELVEARTAAELQHVRGRRFDLVIALETLEHVQPADLPGYLDLLAEVTARRLLVSVPVEIGPVFLLKWAAKSVVRRLRGRCAYSAADVARLTLGRVEKVARNGHKGFDWRNVVREIEVRFADVRVCALPLGGPCWLGFQVGIEASAQSTAAGERSGR